jgi:hypothetical protein
MGVVGAAVSGFAASWPLKGVPHNHQINTLLPGAECRRYVLYVREQQQLARLLANTAQGGGSSGVDLVGYVEFQKSFK